VTSRQSSRPAPSPHGVERMPTTSAFSVSGAAPSSGAVGSRGSPATAGLHPWPSLRQAEGRARRGPGTSTERCTREQCAKAIGRTPTAPWRARAGSPSWWSPGRGPGLLPTGAIANPGTGFAPGASGHSADRKSIAKRFSR
jgi:hypothetical protein